MGVHPPSAASRETDIELLVPALLVLGLGAWLQGSVGFGMNLLAAPLLLAVDARLVPGPLLIAAIVITFLTMLRERGAVSTGRIGWAFVGRVPGAILGTYAVAVLPADGLSLVMAITVLAAVALSVAGLRVEITRSSLAIAGAVSGFTGTTTSVGGPPIALLYQHESGPNVRANLAGFFVLGASLSVTLLAIAGEFTSEHLRLSGLLLVPVVLGFAASTLTRHRIDGERVRPAVLAVAGLSAAALLVRTLVG